MNALTVFSIILFAVTYILMFAFQRIRPYVAMVSAVIFVAAGSLGIFSGYSYTPAEALGQIDWNVLLMIAGTMGTVTFFIDSGMPMLLSDILISKTSRVKWMIVCLSLFAGIISAFVDNVATVLMIAPVAIAVCKKLKISPVPAIICISVSSNLQGAATLVGDTTSILLAKTAGLDFMDFFICESRLGMFFVTEAGAIVSALMIVWMFRKEKQEFHLDTRTMVKDKFPTVMLVLTVVSLIAVSFIPYAETAAPGQLCKPGITNGLICIFFFALCLVRDLIKNRNFKALTKAVSEIDYYTLALLAGLFVVIGGISRAGIIDMIGNAMSTLGSGGSGGGVFLVYTVIVWGSVLLSAFIDNIPYTATMLPVVAVISQNLSASTGTFIDPRLFYFGLLVGATLGGNLTPIGASANITGIGLLRKEGHEVTATQFMKYSVPFTLAAVITGYILVWLIWA